MKQKLNAFLGMMLCATVATTSCGSPKSAAQSDYQYRQWLEQQSSPVNQTGNGSIENQQKSLTIEQDVINKTDDESANRQRPTMKKREVDECIKMAFENTPNIRSYGTATSYIEKNAIAEAERDARNRIAAMLETAIEGAAQDYTQNAQQNMRNTAGSLSESIMTQYVAQKIKNAKIINTSIYDLSDGTITAYVCLEMSTSQEDLEKELENELSRDGVISLQYDRERFINKMSQGLEEYKRKQAEKEQ